MLHLGMGVFNWFGESLQSELRRETEAPRQPRERTAKLGLNETEKLEEQTGVSGFLIVQVADPPLRTLKEITFFCCELVPCHCCHISYPHSEC